MDIVKIQQLKIFNQLKQNFIIQPTSMSKIDTIRQKAQQDSEAVAQKRRLGLFSQPISTAIGDDGPYKTKIHPRNQAGKPVTKQRNFQTSPTKSGKVASSFFGSLNSLATSEIKDVYIEQPKRLMKQQYQKTKAFRSSDKPQFIPASGSKTLANSSFGYFETKKLELDPKRNRQEDGRVKVQPRNFCTNPHSKVVATYWKHEKHMVDEYDRARKMSVQWQKKNKSKEAEVPFKPNSFGAKLINSQKQVREQDVPLTKKPQKQIKLNIIQHESPWKSSNPNKKGLYGFFTPHPVYKQNPPKYVTRRNSDASQKQAFKSMSSIQQSVPSPSVTKTNLKKVGMSLLRGH